MLLIFIPAAFFYKSILHPRCKMQSVFFTCKNDTISPAGSQVGKEPAGRVSENWHAMFDRPAGRLFLLPSSSDCQSELADRQPYKERRLVNQSTGRPFGQGAHLPPCLHGSRGERRLSKRTAGQAGGRGEKLPGK